MRRDYGEGTLRHRQDGRWEGRLSLGVQQGKRLQRYVFAKTRREAQVKLADLRRERDRGTLRSGRRQGLGEFLDAWLHDVAQPRLRPTTFRRYAIFVRELSRDLGAVSLDRLSPERIQRYLNTRSRLSPRTVRQMRAVLRTALNTAVKWQLLASNPAALTEGPRLPLWRPTRLDAEQSVRLLLYTSNRRLGPLYALGLTTALRQGELLGLRWEDIDLDAGTLTVRQNLQKVGRAWVIGEPKSRASGRTIPLISVGVAALQRQRQMQGGHGLVFLGTRGQPLSGAWVTRDFQRLLVEAGLPRLRFHDLRHSCATLLIALGVPATTVMAILGHSNIAMTVDTYTQVMPASLREAMGRLDHLLTTTADASRVVASSGL